MGDDADRMLRRCCKTRQSRTSALTEITLAEARRRIEGPLSRAGADSDFELDDSSILFVPLARSRVRRLPSDDPAQAVVYTAADRAAAVEEFLGSPEAGDAGDPDVARFWATVLTGLQQPGSGRAARPGRAAQARRHAARPRRQHVHAH